MSECDFFIVLHTSSHRVRGKTARTCRRAGPGDSSRRVEAREESRTAGGRNEWGAMSDMVAFTVSVTAEIASVVDGLVASGAYASRSEVVRAAIRSFDQDGVRFGRESGERRTGSGDPSTGPGELSAGGETRDERAGGESGPMSPDPDGATRDAAAGGDPLDTVPELAEHRDAILDLAGEAGVDDLRVPREWLERERARREAERRGAQEDEDGRGLELVTGADPRRPYPVLAGLAAEIGRLVGRHTLIREDHPPEDLRWSGRIPSVPLTRDRATRATDTGPGRPGCRTGRGDSGNPPGDGA